MAYFLEYLIPAESGGADVPVDDANDGSMVPVAETAQRVIHLDALPARSRIMAGALEEARAEAEQLLRHSKARSGELFEDADDALDAGSGRRVGRFEEESGWTDS